MVLILGWKACYVVTWRVRMVQLVKQLGLKKVVEGALFSDELEGCN